MATVLKEPIKKVVREGDLTARGPLDPERIYTMLDGTKLPGWRVIELEHEMRFANTPFNAVFCPSCDVQLELTGAGWRCHTCGAMHEEGDVA
jgi:tRNA(Ile2) C34 agmatinyltransferase TiaS